MATFTANSIQLGTGAEFIGGANGLTDAPTGSIIQTAINGTTSAISANADGSYTDLLSINFTPRQSNSRIIFSIMFHTYCNNTVGTSNGISYRVLRDSTTIKEANWSNYMNISDYTRDWYPIMNISDFDQPNTTNAITYKLQGRKYDGNSNKFATVFGDFNRGSSAVGNTMVMKIEELSI